MRTTIGSSGPASTQVTMVKEGSPARTGVALAVDSDARSRPARSNCISGSPEVGLARRPRGRSGLDSIMSSPGHQAEDRQVGGGRLFLPIGGVLVIHVAVPTGLDLGAGGRVDGFKIAGEADGEEPDGPEIV